MDMGQGSSLRLFWFVCVFALVLASNVVVVNVLPTSMVESQKLKS